jgi:hypothetical protein
MSSLSVSTRLVPFSRSIEREDVVKNSNIQEASPKALAGRVEVQEPNHNTQTKKRKGHPNIDRTDAVQARCMQVARFQDPNQDTKKKISQHHKTSVVSKVTVDKLRKGFDYYCTGSGRARKIKGKLTVAGVRYDHIRNLRQSFGHYLQTGEFDAWGSHPIRQQQFKNLEEYYSAPEHADKLRVLKLGIAKASQ